MGDEKWSEIADKVCRITTAKKILLLIAGGNRYCDEIFHILNSLSSITMDYIITQNATDIHEETKLLQLAKKIDSQKSVYHAVCSADLILIPFMTRNVLSKSAAGIADDLLTTAISQGLMMGKTIISVDTCWNPIRECNQLLKLDRNKAYTNMLYQHKERLEEFGMLFTPIYEFEEQVRGNLQNKAHMKSSDSDAARTSEAADKHPNAGNREVSQNILTYKDIADMDTIVIPEHAKLTDLAKEYIADRKNNLST